MGRWVNRATICENDRDDRSKVTERSPQVTAGNYQVFQDSSDFFGMGIDCCPARSVPIAVHRSRGMSVEEGHITIRKHWTPETDRTDLFMDNIFARQRSLAGDSQSYQKRSDYLFATTISHYVWGDRMDETNLCTGKDWEENKRNATRDSPRYNVRYKRDGVEGRRLDKYGHNDLVQSASFGLSSDSTSDVSAMQGESYDDHEREEDVERK